MTTQLIRVGNSIVNLQQITSVSYTDKAGDTNIWVRFNNTDADIVLQGENATLLWRALKKSSLNFTLKSPELPALDRAQ